MGNNRYSRLVHRNIFISFRHICLTFLIPVGLFSIIATGGGGGTGDDDPGDDGTQNSFISCEETTRSLAGIDEKSAILGISASDVLAEAGGGFSTTATYSGDTSILTQSPQADETELTIVISYDGGEIREIESQPVENDGDGVAPEIAVDCRHRLEIEVSVALSTADGAFSEAWQGILVKSVNSAHDGFDDPSLTAEFNPESIKGSFKIISISGDTPDSVTGTLSTTLINPFNGSIDILVEQTSGSGNDATVSLTRHLALSWGKSQ